MKRAFTLIEAMFVIGVIAILVGILLPAVGDGRRMAKNSKCKMQLHSLGQLTIIYYNDYRRLPLAHEFPTTPETYAWGSGPNSESWWICPEAKDDWRYSYLAGAFMQHSLTAVDPDPKTVPEVTSMYENTQGLAMFEDASNWHSGWKNVVRFSGEVYTRR